MCFQCFQLVGSLHEVILATVFLSRIQSRVLSQPTSPIQQWVSGLRTPQAFRPRHLSFPQPSSAPPSVTCHLWSLTRRWASGIRAPPRRRTHWEASLPMEKGRESLLVGWTHCLSTLSLVSNSQKILRCFYAVQ